MHHRLIVSFDKDEAKSSEEARSYVQNRLESDTSFLGEGGRFNSPICDWFVIGGRWSGDLVIRTLDKDFDEEVKKIVPKSHDFGYSTHEVEENKDKFQKVWESLGQKSLNPYNRSSYDSLGQEDDAQIVNKKIYEKILKEYEDSEDGVSEKGEWGDISYVDLDYDNPTPETFIDKKWVVVVDYHS